MHSQYLISDMLLAIRGFLASSVASSKDTFSLLRFTLERVLYKEKTCFFRSLIDPGFISLPWKNPTSMPIFPQNDINLASITFIFFSVEAIVILMKSHFSLY